MSKYVVTITIKDAKPCRVEATPGWSCICSRIVEAEDGPSAIALASSDLPAYSYRVERASVLAIDEPKADDDGPQGFTT